MPDGLIVIVSGLSGVLGALVGGLAARSVETLRLNREQERADSDRLLDAMSAFTTAALFYARLVGSRGLELPDDAKAQRDELQQRRSDALVRILLLSSAELEEWMSKNYTPVEDQTSERINEAVERRDESAVEEASAAYIRFLGEVTTHFREELAIKQPGSRR